MNLSDAYGSNETDLSLPKISPRIYGGRTVKIEHYPYQVRVLENITKNKIQLCGGSIITELHILTAAHCVSYQ